MLRQFLWQWWQLWHLLLKGWIKESFSQDYRCVNITNTDDNWGWLNINKMVVGETLAHKSTRRVCVCLCVCGCVWGQVKQRMSLLLFLWISDTVCSCCQHKSSYRLIMCVCVCVWDRKLDVGKHSTQEAQLRQSLMTGVVWADVDNGLPTVAKGGNLNSQTQVEVIPSKSPVFLQITHTQDDSGAFHTNNAAIHREESTQTTLWSIWRYQAANGTLSQHAHLGPESVMAVEACGGKCGMCCAGRCRQFSKATLSEENKWGLML